MDAVFKIKASEFNEALFAKIKSLIKGGSKAITISVNDEDEYYEAEQAVKKEAAKKAVDFFKTIETDMSNFKFDRDEANER